jgi:hypothetical protein
VVPLILVFLIVACHWRSPYLWAAFDSRPVFGELQNLGYLIVFFHQCASYVGDVWSDWESSCPASHLVVVALQHLPSACVIPR